jgi:putative tryptophan/tyrosine transport system substrate-binding protein
MASHIGRRKFLATLGGVAAAWPLAARAQLTDRVRRVGVLMGFGENDPEAKAFLSAFTKGLAELGWSGRNVRIDVRWAAGDLDRMQKFAKELVDLESEVILTQLTPVTAAVRRETRAIPIIFVMVVDPVREGFVASVPRPGGNLTGFMLWETSIPGKWLELLNEIAPGIKRAAIMFNPDTYPGRGSYALPPFEAAARSFKVEPIVAPVRSDGEIEMAIVKLGREPGSGLVLPGDAFTEGRRALIISLAGRNNLPALYPNAGWARDGGLLSFGTNMADEFRRAASYVDRILRGAKPADLPVQLPVKFEMVLNAKTAKALALTVPPSILLRADEVIE